MSSDERLPRAPNDEDLRTAIIKLVGAASYYRAALRGLLDDPTAVSASDHEAFLEAHAKEFDKADEILKGWADALGLKADPGDPFPG